MTLENRIHSYTTFQTVGSEQFEVHYYSRFIGPETELWLFGNGLGDQTTMKQVGDAFLELVDEGRDPGLGRVMISFGHGSTAYLNYKGDYNVVWAWGVKPEELEHYLNNFQVKPDLILNPYHVILEKAEALGYATQRFWSGVNSRLFKPLGLRRSGYGYSGLPKSKEQIDTVLGPVLGRKDFDWISRAPNKNGQYLPIPDYVRWLNSKKLVFGMLDEDRHDVLLIPTRFFETVATATPIIYYRINGLKEHCGFDYPYLTESREQTEAFIEEIMGDYTRVQEYLLEKSRYIREHHNYKTRLTELFKTLGAL